jgi:hypothetical protein
VAKKMFTVTLKEQEQWEGPVKVNGTDWSAVDESAHVEAEQQITE